MFSLLEALPAEDKNKINNYISCYGAGSHFIGVDAWLEHWAKNKIKLYKMLGNSFINRISYQYEKPEDELRNQLYNFLDVSEFDHNYSRWINSCWDLFPSEVRRALANIPTVASFYNDKIPMGVKFKREGAARELQLQEGMKPMRALSKVIDYFKDDLTFNEKGYLDKDAFEKFRLEHSRILNDKMVKGELVISIHPLDFMTMSDNASNWSSCMNWTKDGGEGGCYHVGTVEMMNSNNVVCCYMESSEPYYFNKEGDGTEEYRWTNKKWRQLFYVTKDIIVGGKAYPFVNTSLTKEILQRIRALACDNLNWRYSFGPELYSDMKHIYSSYSMDRARGYIHTKKATKHNILFDTKGMYNDMLNDHDTKYWCVRNKVEHTKIISYSGKAPCLCCGETVLSEGDEPDYYNNRFDNTGSVICEDCKEKLFTCSCCSNSTPFSKFYTYKDAEGREHKVCEKCWQTRVYICPICKKPMFISLSRPDFYNPITTKENINDTEITKRYFDWSFGEDGNPITFDDDYHTMKPVFLHESCANKIGFIEKRYHTFYHDIYYKIAPYNKREELTKCYFHNLEKPEYEEDIKITEMLDLDFHSYTYY